MPPPGDGAACCAYVSGILSSAYVSLTGTRHSAGAIGSAWRHGAPTMRSPSPSSARPRSPCPPAVADHSRHSAARADAAHVGERGQLAAHRISAERRYRHADPGHVGDMLGKEKIIVAVLIALTVGSLISALATSLPVMLVGRVIQGTGGAVFPLAFGIIRDEFPAERVAGAIGVMSAIGGRSRSRDRAGRPDPRAPELHWLFSIPMIMSSIATVATYCSCPNRPSELRGRKNWLGAGLMSAWLVTGLLAMSSRPCGAGQFVGDGAAGGHRGPARDLGRRGRTAPTRRWWT